MFLPLFALALGAMLLAVVLPYRALHLGGRMVLFLSALFVIGMTCHGELTALKPHPRQLTRFYLTIAFGGMLGGLFVSLIAPQIFPGYYELPLSMIVSAVVVLAVLWRDKSSSLYRSRYAWKLLAASGLIVVLAATLARHAAATAQTTRVMVRNFYGALQVFDYVSGSEIVRSLRHGAIVHGAQLTDALGRRRAITYYNPASGVGAAMRATQSLGSQRVGVVGLGVGTLAAYARRGDNYRFYEINPLIVTLARTQFTYLGDCAGTTDVVLGDARLSLNAEPPQNFDLLAIDAFSGDSIPIHLLTREAFAIYFRHLKPDGMLAVHISNRYLDLAPVVKQSSAYFGRDARIIDTHSNDQHVDYGATWVLVGTAQKFSDPALQSASAIPATHIQPWSDDFSSLYPLLK